MMTTKNIDISKNPTEQQKAMLDALKNRPIEYDEENLILTADELQRFKKI